MTAPSKERRLVVSADDFGCSASVNRAVAAASRRGALSAASIVAGGDAFDEAVDLAVRRPALSSSAANAPHRAQDIAAHAHR